jgi:hypothetical protein
MGEKSAPKKMETMADHARDGGKHLREHMRETAKPIDRSYCEPTKDSH